MIESIFERHICQCQFSFYLETHSSHMVKKYPSVTKKINSFHNICVVHNYSSVIITLPADFIFLSMK